MVDLPDGFPFTSSTRQIKRLLPQIWKDPRTTSYDLMLQMGQSELQNRAVRFTGWVALGLAVVTLVVSLLAAYYAREALRSSDRWETPGPSRSSATGVRCRWRRGTA